MAYMQQGLQKIILFIFILAGNYMHAQVKFTASVTPRKVDRDAYAQLKLVVENADEVQQIVPPSLKDFIIISGPNQESGMTMVNGVVKKYIALNFILKPRTIGNYTIGSALAKADGGDYTSNPVTLQVSSSYAGNSAGANPASPLFSTNNPFTESVPHSNYNESILRKGENPAEKIRKNMFVKAEADKKSVFIGQPLVVTYKLYTRLKSESNITKNPAFNGFSVLEMPETDDMGHQTERFEGREYNVYIIRKVQLYPLLAGNLELGSAAVENNIQFIKAEYLNQQAGVVNDLLSEFSDLAIPPEGIVMQKILLQSKPLHVEVKPLPNTEKFTGFKGAVGNFKIDSRVEKNNFTIDDDGKLAIIISGEGNLQMVNAPEIDWPPGIDGFDPKATDELAKGTVPVSGRKIFVFPFTVSKPGTYLLPAVEFCYFDISAAVYKTVTSKPIEIHVSKSTGKSKIVTTDTHEKPRDNFLTKFFSNRLRVVSLIALLIIIGLYFWLRTDSKREKKSAASTMPDAYLYQNQKLDEESLPIQINHLDEAEASMNRNETKLFYYYLNQGIKNFLSQKLALPPEAINKKKIAEKISEIGIDKDTSAQLQKLIDDVDWQLYTPFADNNQMKDMYKRADEIIGLINSVRS